jgi:hypothetical protein
MRIQVPVSDLFKYLENDFDMESWLIVLPFFPRWTIVISKGEVKK